MNICKLREILLGFEKAHKWRPVARWRYIGEPGPKGSTALYCVRCGENGWRLV